MDAQAKALIGCFAGFIGKSQSELEAALTIKDADGNIVLKKPEEIKSYLEPLGQEKLKRSTEESISQAAGRAKRETFEEIEKLIFEKTGVEGRLSDGLIEKVVEAQKTIKLDPSNVKNSETYKNDIQNLKNEHKKSIDLYEQKIEGIRKEQVRSAVRSKVVDWVNKPENNLIVPEHEGAKNALIKSLTDDLVGLEIDGHKANLSIDVNQDIIMKNSDGNSFKDANLNDVSFVDKMKSIGMEKYFPKSANTPRTTSSTPTGPVYTSTSTSRSLKIGDTTYNYPEFEDKSALNKWMLSEEGRSLPAEARVEIRAKVAEELQTSS